YFLASLRPGELADSQFGHPAELRGNRVPLPLLHRPGPELVDVRAQSERRGRLRGGARQARERPGPQLEVPTHDRYGLLRAVPAGALPQAHRVRPSARNMPGKVQLRTLPVACFTPE